MVGNSLVVQWLGRHTSTTEGWVQSLVRELIFCKLHSEAKIFFKMLQQDISKSCKISEICYLREVSMVFP